MLLHFYCTILPKNIVMLYKAKCLREVTPPFQIFPINISELTCYNNEEMVNVLNKENGKTMSLLY